MTADRALLARLGNAPGSKLDREQIWKVARDPASTKEELLDLFARSKDPIAELYQDSVGVPEPYAKTLEAHTLMVMGNRETFFKNAKLPDGVDLAMLRIADALHDIAKPLAVEAGDKSRQHEFSAPVIQSVLKQLRMPPSQIRVVMALLAHDPIGEYIKGTSVKQLRPGEGDKESAPKQRLSATEAANQISGLAGQAKLKPSEFLDLLMMFYMCDAASYTKQASGNQEWTSIIDKIQLFEMDVSKGQLRFGPKYTQAVDELMREVRSRDPVEPGGAAKSDLFTAD